MPILENAKHEKFCQEYVRFPNGRAAYKAAYGVDNDATADVNASRLLSSAKVAARVAELQEEAKSKAVMDAQEIMELLSSIARDELDEEQVVTVGDGDGMSHAEKIRKGAALKDRMKAVDILNKMGGNYDNSAVVTVVVPQFGGEDGLED